MNPDVRDQIIVELYNSGLLLKEISPRVGVTAAAVGRILRRNGIERPFKPRRGKDAPDAPTCAEAKKTRLVTVEWLREHADYDPETGLLTCKKRWCDRLNVGDILGTPMKTTGHLTVEINYGRYLVHRLIWLWVTGKWPERGIDHWDLDPSNNRWRNLRLGTQSQNMHNVGLRKDNTSGFKGVFKPKGRRRWRARIKVAGKEYNLGCFQTRDEAAAAYAVAAKRMMGEFARVPQ